MYIVYINPDISALKYTHMYRFASVPFFPFLGLTDAGELHQLPKPAPAIRQSQLQ